MKVLVADAFQESGLDELRALGCEVAYEPKLKDDALRDTVARTDCGVLIVRSTKVGEAVMNAGRQLALIVRAGAGVNTIDLAAANRRSILVANCPGKNAIAVAELTFGLILALDRRLVENVVDLRHGVWNKSEYSRARGLKDRTLGVVGLGQIGEAVVRRAQAFDMKVVAWSRSLTPVRAEALRVTRADSPSDVAAACDVLTIHLAAARDTKNLINADVLNRLKPGSYVINTARADVVDYRALSAAVLEKSLRVGLDVFPDEPSGGAGSFSDALVRSGGVIYGTHHIGASTDQAQDAIAAEAVRIVRVFMQTGRVENCVNIRSHSPARYVLVVRHRNRPGVLAHTLNVISHAGVNVEEMENVICDGAENACAFIKLDAPLSDALLGQVQTGNEHVIGVSVGRL
jgi:D-3-phosphoglycerate dehydrogenase